MESKLKSSSSGSSTFTLHCKFDDYLLLFRVFLILEKMMKKKDIKKLKLNVVTFLSLLLSLFLTGGLILSIFYITHLIINNKPDVIAYKETLGYGYIILPIILLAAYGFMPYQIMEEQLYQEKRKNQKIPKHKKVPKGEKQYKLLKNGFIIGSIVLILLAFPICINARWELHSDGIYKITITGREKQVCSWNEITGFSIQTEKSRHHYSPLVVVNTERKSFYLQTYKNAQVKRDLFKYLKNRSDTQIDVQALQKYYNKFSDENRELVDLLLN